MTENIDKTLKIFMYSSTQFMFGLGFFWFFWNVNEILSKERQSYAIPIIYSACFCITLDFINTYTLRRSSNLVFSIISFFSFVIMMSIFTKVLIFDCFRIRSHISAFFLYAGYVTIFVIQIITALLTELAYLIHSIYGVQLKYFEVWNIKIYASCIILYAAMMFCLHFLVDRTTLPHGYDSIGIIGSILVASNFPHVYRMEYFDKGKFSAVFLLCGLHFMVVSLSPREIDQRKIDPDFSDDQTSLSTIFQVSVVVGGYLDHSYSKIIKSRESTTHHDPPYFVPRSRGS